MLAPEKKNATVRRRRRREIAIPKRSSRRQSDAARNVNTFFGWRRSSKPEASRAAHFQARKAILVSTASAKGKERISAPQFDVEIISRYLFFLSFLFSNWKASLCAFDMDRMGKRKEKRKAHNKPKRDIGDEIMLHVGVRGTRSQMLIA